LAYRIEIIRPAQKQLLGLSREMQLEIARAIDGLASEPRPRGCRKLRGTELWRIRLGRHRVIYIVDEKAALITIIKVAARSEDTYQGL
jgi:mRNA interferase RelE/StbE